MFDQDTEYASHPTDYLNDIIRHLNEIYKCHCENCIVKRTVYELIEFYKFITIHKNMITNDANYLSDIVEIIRYTSSFHNQREDIENIVFNNKQMQVISIYLDQEYPLTQPEEFRCDINTYVKYHPETKEYLLSY